MNKPVVNITEEKKITVTIDGIVQYTCEAADGWDLGDDLLIAAGRVWAEEAGHPIDPVEVDQEWLDERAAGVLFTVEQMDDLRELAAERGKTLTQLIREEMLATLEFDRWDKDNSEHGD